VHTKIIVIYKSFVYILSLSIFNYLFFNLGLAWWYCLHVVVVGADTRVQVRRMASILNSVRSVNIDLLRPGYVRPPRPHIMRPCD
jgi:hypothetical protein